MSGHRPSELERALLTQFRLLETTLKPGTVSGYRSVIRHFLQFMRRRFPEVTRPRQLTRDPHLLGWLEELWTYRTRQGQPLHNTTRGGRVLQLRTLLDMLQDGPRPPAPDLLRRSDVPKRQFPLPRPLNADDDRRLCQYWDTAPGWHDSALYLMRLTGMRIGECVDLAPDCLRHFGDGRWSIHVPHGKPRSERWVPLDDQARALIERLTFLRSLPGSAADPGFLLPRPRGRADLMAALRAGLRAAAAQAGVQPHLVPHQLRHTYATTMLRAGVSLPALMRLLGHHNAMNQVLDEAGFDRFAETACQGFYADKMGRPGLAPGTYFRCLLIGYFEGIDSERGIAWRVSDSLGLRDFLGFPLSEATPDHSTISRTRRLIAMEAHQEIFGWVLKQIAQAGLVKGTTIGIDATTLEANAAMRTIVRKDTGETYQEFLTRLATESGIETPTREDLARMDRKREKRMSNREWMNPNDPDARIAKMKDGSTHMAHKVEHAVDMETGAIIALTLQGADLGDTQTIGETLPEAGENIAETAAAVNDEEAGELVNPEGPEEVVTDKGYHSNAVLMDLEQVEVRSYIPEPDRGKRNWDGKAEEKAAVYGNRRRVKGPRGKRLLKGRGELLERSFAHMYETGGMRRTHLTKHDNILKRLLVHAAGFNLGLLMRSMGQAGKCAGGMIADNYCREEC